MAELRNRRLWLRLLAIVRISRSGLSRHLLAFRNGKCTHKAIALDKHPEQDRGEEVRLRMTVKARCHQQAHSPSNSLYLLYNAMLMSFR